MKTYIKTLIFGGLLAPMASCTNLDTDIKTQYTEFPDNDIAMTGALEGCYYYVRNEAWLGRNFWEGVGPQADEYMGCNYEGAYWDNGRYFYAGVHNMNPDMPGAGLMGDMMSGITYTNQTILMIQGDEEYGGEKIAPLRAIRAFYHFLMMDLYGDVPILDPVYHDIDVVDRSPRAEVAKYIESELLAVIPQLTETNDITTYGRPNKWMAEALLAKLYLNWGVYTNKITEVTNDTPNEKLNDCVYWCDQLIESGVFEVGQGYRKKFFPDNGVHIKDFIYACPFDPATLGTGYWGGHEMNRFWDYRLIGLTEPWTWGWKPSSSIAGIYILTPECVDRFNLPGDERNEMILVGPQTTFDDNFNKTDEIIMVYTNSRHSKEYGQLDYKKTFEWGDVKTFSLGDETVENCMKGARLAKYPPRQTDYDLYNKKQSNDIPIFRYADILLTKAECILRGATATLGATPDALINEVRDCSHAPHISGANLQDVLDERGRELVMEMWRRQDLIRYGQFENDWGWKHEANPAAKTDLTKRLMPIPTGELNTNTNWSQNEGY